MCFWECFFLELVLTIVDEELVCIGLGYHPLRFAQATGLICTSIHWTGAQHHHEGALY